MVVAPALTLGFAVLSVIVPPMLLVDVPRVMTLVPVCVLVAV